MKLIKLRSLGNSQPLRGYQNPLRWIALACYCSESRRLSLSRIMDGYLPPDPHERMSWLGEVFSTQWLLRRTILGYI